MLRLVLLLAAVAVPASATGLFDPATAVDDAELARHRGGFALPNGVDVALTVQTDTAVDGALVLRSVYRLETGAPTLAVFAPAPGTTGPRVTLSSATPAPGTTISPTVTIDRAGGISTVAWSQPLPVAQINVTRASEPIGMAPEGLAPLPVVAGGPGIATAGGVVSVTELSRGTRVDLAGPMLDVTHLVGQAFGTIIANTADNRAIDTATTLDFDLRNASTLSTASATLRAQDIVQNTLTGRVF